MKRTRLESEVKTEVMATLRRLGCLCFRMNAGKIRLGSNGKSRFLMLAPSGTADILAFVGRLPLWIETKRDGKVQSREQLQFEAMVKNMGHHYVVARDAETVALAVTALRGIEQ